MDSSTKQAWYSMLTLDSFAHVISTSLFHPFVAWIIPLSFRAVLVSYSDRRFIISSVWAALMTARFIFNVFSHRIAYGLPRDLDWEEEVVVITGGASGLGLVLAETYGMRGASVAVLDVADVENAEDRGIVAYKCDVGNREEVQRVAKMIEKDLGPPTILINNAGIVNGKPLLSLTQAEIERNFSVNLLGHFNTLQTFLPGMLESPIGATVVTVASVLGHLGAANLSDYTAAKAGLIALHNSLNAELRQSKEEGARYLKTILVTPGQLATPMFKGVKTPSRFFAPIVEPVTVAKALVKMIDYGESGELSLPFYAYWINLMGLLPVGVQTTLRDLSGIDTAMAKGFGGKTQGKYQ